MIKFIREYEFYGYMFIDIVYESMRIYTMPKDEMPKTAKKFLEGKTGVKQYDPVFKRDEIIYK